MHLLDNDSAKDRLRGAGLINGLASRPLSPVNAPINDHLDENIRRLAEIATHLARNGHIAIVAAVSPSAEDRAAARRIADTTFREVYVATSAEVCESRDPKGHYAKARAGSLRGFTGIGNDYQPPAACELTIDTSARSVPEATDEIEQMLVKSGILFDEPVDLAANI